MWKGESGSTTLWREEFSADDSVKALGGFLLASLFLLVSVTHSETKAVEEE